MDHRLATGQPPRAYSFSSLAILSDHIQSLPYGEEDLSWILTVLTPPTPERLAQLPWNVQWRIWLRNECEQPQRIEPKGNEFFVGKLDSIVVALQGLVLQKSLMDDSAEHHFYHQHHHDLLFTTTHNHHQLDDDDDEGPWKKDFMLRNWSTSQRYHVQRDVHKCWMNWDPDQRRDVDSILHALDQLLLDNNEKKLPGEERLTKTRENSPLAVVQQMRGALASPQQVCRMYWQEQIDNTEKESKDGTHVVDRKPPPVSLDDFKRWIRTNLCDLPDLKATEEGLQQLCRYLGEQGANSAAYHNIRNMEHAKEIFAETVSIKVHDVASYQGLSLLLSATPHAVPEATLQQIYKSPLPRVGDDVNVNVVCDIVKNYLAFDESVSDAPCPNLNALVVFIWDHVFAIAIKSSESSENELIEGPEPHPELSVLYETITKFRSWLPLEAILPRYQYLLLVLFEAKFQSIQKTEYGSNDEVAWKKYLREVVRRHYDSLRLLRNLLCCTTQMVRLLNVSPDTQEHQWSCLFSKELCSSLYKSSFAFGLVLSIENTTVYPSCYDPTSDVFQKFFLFCSFLESLISVSEPLKLPPFVAWFFCAMGATARIPIGIVVSQPVQHIGQHLIQQYQRIMNKTGLSQRSSECDPSWVDACVEALIPFCHRCVWSSIVSNVWCSSMAHAVCRLAGAVSNVGQFWIATLKTFLTDVQSLDQDNVKLSPLLRCLHEHIVRKIWCDEPVASGLAHVILDAFSGDSVDAQQSCSLSCILRSSPPAALFQGADLGTDVVERVLNAFGTKDVETAGVILVGIALRLGQCAIETCPYESHDCCLRIAQTFVRDCSNGCFGVEMVRVIELKDRVVGTLAECGAAIGLEWWGKVFPCESPAAVVLKRRSGQNFDRAFVELERTIQLLDKGRQRGVISHWNSSDQEAPKAHRSGGSQRKKLQSTAKEASLLSVREKRTAKKRFHGEQGTAASLDCRPPMVYSAPDVCLDIKNKKDDHDSVILLDL